MESRRLPLALLWIMLDLVEALHVDVVVDDTDPRIKYTGSNWTTVDHCQECGAGLNISRVEGGSYHMVHQANHDAKFNFTGTAISVHGVVPVQHSREWRPPKVSFILDGTATTMDLTNESGGLEPAYNKTLFLADNLPEGAHTLSIQTHDESLFILDCLTFTTNATVRSAAANDTSPTDSAASTSSTFPYDQANSSSGGAPPAVVGGVIGGIFGAFLMIGIIGLWFVKRSNKRRRKRKSSSGRTPHQRSPLDRKELSPGGSSGGPSDRSGKRRDDQKKRTAQPVEYAFSGPKPVHTPMPLTTTRRLEALSAAANDGTGNYRSPLSTFASSSSGGEDGKVDVIHAITTDTPQEAHPAPLYGQSRWQETRRPNTAEGMKAARQWQQAERPNTADPLRTVRPFSSGSTLEVDGVLERVMQNHSNVPEYPSREAESPVYFSDHPFRTNG